MCNLFIQLYDEKTSKKPEEKVKLVVATNYSNNISECLTISCNDNAPIRGVK
ncbi:MAG: hypothetical protein FWD52_04325 [Candidatus Bathyarchaeota archaeon]|nr:hypothetical protein [Candidatus Termiticorpusculum sp.]